VVETTIYVRELHVHRHGATDEQLAAIHAALQGLHMDLSQATAEITALTGTVTKIKDETSTLLQRISDLTAVIDAGMQTTPEFDAALAALKEQVAVVDGLVPDEPPAVG
jgi:ABC-type transporter Mla subunit MlaD